MLKMRCERNAQAPNRHTNGFDLLTADDLMNERN